MRKQRMLLIGAACAAALGLMHVSEVWSLQGRGRGGGGGQRAAGHRAASAPRQVNHGPAMARPPMQPGVGAAGGNRAGLPNKGGGAQRPQTGGAPAYHRPSNPIAGQPRPGDRPGAGGGVQRPEARPRPGGGASAGQLDDFLGRGKPGLPGISPGQPGPGDNNRPGGDRGRPGDRDRPGDRTPPGDRDRPDRRIGDVNVNVDKSIDYRNNQQAWVNNRHTAGNQVRVNAGNRYANAYRGGNFHRGPVNYPYYRGWANRGPYYGWRAATFTGVGAFLGATWANARPVYYAYGAGGNVYYEQNVVYVDGQPAGTPEQYAQQSFAQVEAAPAPEQVGDADWMPLGAFAVTREGVGDSQGMVELAISKQGVIAGTYYNEATGVSRPLKGTLDPKTQRVAIGFADGKNADAVLETGIYNLTQEEAPALLHFGKTESSPALLVRLQPPADSGGR